MTLKWIFFFNLFKINLLFSSCIFSDFTALEKKESVKQKKAEEEKKIRFQDSMKAYEKWREKAKNTPRPATQGLLRELFFYFAEYSSNFLIFICVKQIINLINHHDNFNVWFLFTAHQKAKPLFTNPTPWQPLVDNTSDTSDTEYHADQIKTSGTTNKSQRSKKPSVKR